jgi:hypothetical protein
MLRALGIPPNLPLDVILGQHVQDFGLVSTDPVEEKGGDDLFDGVSLAHVLNASMPLGSLQPFSLLWRE